MRSPLTDLQPAEARSILLVWAVWSLGIVCMASAAMALPVNHGSPWTGVFHAPPLARWDSSWYHSVEVEGYRFDPSRPENNVGFYPLYPKAAGLLARALHTPLLATGIALSIACLGAALLLMGDLFAGWGGAGSGVAGAAALLAFPTAFFLAAFYTESLFLLCLVAAFWAARRERWLLAGIAGFAAGLTRFNGFLIVPALALQAWLSVRTRREGSRLRPALAVLLAAAGACAYPLYLWNRFGDPLLYVRSKMMGWPVKPTAPWTLLGSVGSGLWTDLAARRVGSLVELLSVGLFTVLTVALFRRGLKPEGVFAGSTLLLLLTSGTLAGVQRYVLVLFPCYFPLAQYLRTRPAVAVAYGFLGIGGGVVLLHRFVHWYFVG